MGTGVGFHVTVVTGIITSLMTIAVFHVVNSTLRREGFT